jgi:hypothetical protein
MDKNVLLNELANVFISMAETPWNDCAEQARLRERADELIARGAQSGTARKLAEEYIELNS